MNLKRMRWMILALAAGAALAGLGESLVFLGAHPDDTEGYAATAFLLKRAGYDIHVVDLTRGELGLGPEGLKDGSTARKRVEEEKAACAYLGATPHFLCEVDGFATASEKAAQMLAEILKETKPKAVFTHWPVDTHGDHMQCAAVMKRAQAIAGMRPQWYFFEVQRYQTRNWKNLYSIDVSETISNKVEMLRKYACQNASDGLAMDKLDQARQRGRERVPAVAAAELFTTFDGQPIPGGVLESLKENAAHLALSVGPLPKKEKGDFTLATFNVRCPYDVDERVWYRRMPRIAQVVRTRDFDLFGVQEAVSYEVNALEFELPGFAHVGCGRDQDRGGESMLIFYRKDRFECLESGTFWLSEHPDEPGSKYTGAGCPRTCTWALLKDKVTGRSFRYFNTHLDHISSKARWDGMQVLLERGVRPAKARGETVLLTGDLNETLDPTDEPSAIAALAGPKLAASAKENPIALVSTELTDTYALSEKPHQGTFRTFHGYQGEPSCRIDYIFATPDVKVRAHATLNDMPDGQFPSDHYPVAVIIRQ